jgi:hypothetical protein
MNSSSENQLVLSKMVGVKHSQHEFSGKSTNVGKNALRLQLMSHQNRFVSNVSTVIRLKAIIKPAGMNFFVVLNRREKKINKRNAVPNDK